MTQPLPLGPDRLADFGLDPSIRHLNHGSFGATPASVLRAQGEWRARMERNPSAFFFEILPAALRAAAARLAAAFGGRPDDWAFIENTTAGVNAVLASLPWRDGDEVIVTSQVYNAVALAIRHHAVSRGARVVPLALPLPFADEAALLAAAARLVTPRTRLAVLDHVSSTGATVLPVEQLTALFRTAGVAVLIDGAHALGMLPLDVPGIGADWYAGNLHKWCYAPKGCAALWTAEGRQKELHPPVISHDYGRGFPVEFDYVGTRDATAWLAAGAALDYLETLGPQRVREHCRRVAFEAAAMLAAAWNTEVSAAGDWRGSMASIRLPRNDAADRQRSRALTLTLLHRHGIMAPIMPLDGRYWLRISAALYNGAEDYGELAAIGPAL